MEMQGQSLPSGWHRGPDALRSSEGPGGPTRARCVAEAPGGDEVGAPPRGLRGWGSKDIPSRRTAQGQAR